MEKKLEKTVKKVMGKKVKKNPVSTIYPAGAKRH